MPVKHVTPVRAISAPITHARWDPILSQGALSALCTMMLFAGTWADSSHANDTVIQSQQIVAPDAAADGQWVFAQKSVPLHGDGFFAFVEFYWNVTIEKLWKFSLHRHFNGTDADLFHFRRIGKCFRNAFFRTLYTSRGCMIERT